MSHFVVVGGGLSGLAAAWRLRQCVGVDHRITVLEASSLMGGKAQTTSEDGWLVESGPSAFLMRGGALNDLIEGLGMEADLVRPVSKGRLLFSGGRLRWVTANPVGLVWQGLLSPIGALRLCFEPLIRRGVQSDESIFAFAQRRFGVEVAESLVSPMVLGVSAGDAREVSTDAVFPDWSGTEQRYGSMIRAAFSRPRGTTRMVGMRRGVGSIVQRLLASGRFEVRSGTAVSTFRQSSSGSVVLMADGSELNADGLIVALPPQSAAEVFPAGPVKEALSKLREPAVYVASVGFPMDRVPSLPQAFGVLVPRDQGLRSLGVIFESQVFGGRAPAGQVLLRVLLGGGVDREITDLSDDTIKDLVLSELETILGINVQPSFWRLTRWSEAIPEGRLGHPALRTQIEEGLIDLPGVYLAGTGVWGIGVGKAVSSGFRAAEYLAGDGD